jgi:hypothetical protein
MHRRSQGAPAGALTLAVRASARRRKFRTLITGLLVAAGVAAFPAAASAAKCDDVATAKVFAPLGDLNDYFLAPGGDFEGKQTWKTSGPVFQTWTHPQLPGAGPTGMVLASGASITSPNLCADLQRPTLRFGAYAYRGTGSLRVEAIDGNSKSVLLGRLAGADFTNGGVTGNVAFGTVLGIVPDSFKHVQLRLTAESGTWVADAVYVDPYMR